MPQIAQVTVISVALGADGLTVPKDVTHLNAGQTAHHAQQAGLAHTVNTADIQPLAGFKHAEEVGKQGSTTPDAAKMRKGEGQGERRGRVQCKTARGLGVKLSPDRVLSTFGKQK